MSTACGRWTIAFNGEIYRFAEMRAELDARRRTHWRGHSDTEVLLECIAEDGFERTIERTHGMLALAAVDVQEGLLWFASDRAGKKPLYYGWSNGVFVFGSELKALAALGSMPEIDRNAAAMMLRYGFVPAPHSIHRGICKLSQGTIARLDLRKATCGTMPTCRTYWSIADLAIRTEALRDERCTAVERVEAVLESAVRRRMVADVPVGAFLSGGIDSSIVCALMVRAAAGRVRTFSMGFKDKRVDESEHAERVARALGTDHLSMQVSEEDMLAVVPRLTKMFDEPFSDSSQIPTFLVSQLARRHVTVALSGDGGDELFGGYNRYRFALTAWQRLASVPWWLRSIGAVCLSGASPVIRSLDVRLGLSSRLPQGSMRALLRVPASGANLLSKRTFPDVYRQIMTGWSSPPVVGLNEEESGADAVLCGGLMHAALGSKSWMMATDFQSYLPGDILVKVDRASMANSLEVRCPFLDSEVVDVAWSLPDECRIGARGLKVTLHELARRLVPPEVVDRPKMGFGVPLATWLRGPLRMWMEDLLSDGSLRSQGVLEPTPVRASLDALMAGADGEQGRVWSAMMLAAWCRDNQACVG